MLDQVRDDIGAALLYLGYDINTQDKAQIDEAKELLKAQKPHVLAYVVEDVQDKMVAGEASVAMCWSGDAMIMKETRPELEYVIPKEGTNMWWDSFVILKDSPNKEPVSYTHLDVYKRQCPRMRRRRKLSPPPRRTPPSPPSWQANRCARPSSSRADW